MLLAAIVPIGAAFGRMGWIPGNNMQATYDVSALLEPPVDVSPSFESSSEQPPRASEVSAIREKVRNVRIAFMCRC